MAIGQGDLLVTPLEMAAGVAAIANGGTLYEPRIAKEVVSADDGSTIRKIGVSVKEQNFISGEALRIVRDGMRRTITAGSGLSVFGKNFPVEVAGKTGTAQFGNEKKTHAWFTSFAPFGDPKIVIVVFIEGGGEGYQTAAPVAKAAYQWYNENAKSLE
jgi:penicillin-binding protein 2